MFKLKTLLKVLVLLPFLLVALLIDGLIFALANSCGSCASFGQYLTSQFSLFNSLFLVVAGLVAALVRKK